MQWPFKDMVEGEVRVLYDVNPTTAAIAAHNYGRTKGWRFKTRKCVEADGRVGLVVKRLRLAPSQLLAEINKPEGCRVYYGYEDLEVGQSVTFTDREICGKVAESIYARGRAMEKRFRRTTEVDRDTQEYVRVTVYRTR